MANNRESVHLKIKQATILDEYLEYLARDPPTESELEEPHNLIYNAIVNNNLRDPKHITLDCANDDSPFYYILVYTIHICPACSKKHCYNQIKISISNYNENEWTIDIDTPTDSYPKFKNVQLSTAIQQMLEQYPDFRQHILLI